MPSVVLFPRMMGSDGNYLHSPYPRLFGADGKRLLSKSVDGLLAATGADPGGSYGDNLTSLGDWFSYTDLDIDSVLPPGFLRTRALDDAITAAWIANDYQPLSNAQVLAITGPAPALITSLPRLPDTAQPIEWGR